MLFSNQKNVLFRFLLSFLFNGREYSTVLHLCQGGYHRIWEQIPGNGKTAAPVSAKLSDASDQSDKREKRTESVLRGREDVYFNPINFAALL